MNYFLANEKYIKSLRSHKYALSPYHTSLPNRMLWTKLLDEVLEVIKIVDERCDHSKKYHAPLEDSLLTGEARKESRMEICNSCDFRTTITSPDTIIIHVKKEDYGSFSLRGKQIAVITLRVNPEILTPILLSQLENLSADLEQKLEDKRREKARKEILKGLKDTSFTKEQFNCRMKYL